MGERCNIFVTASLSLEDAAKNHTGMVFDHAPAPPEARTNMADIRNIMSILYPPIQYFELS